MVTGIGNIFTLATFTLSPSRRIFLNIIAAYGRSLCALVVGLFCGRWVLTAVGKSEFGLYGVVGGMTVIALLAFAMRLSHGSATELYVK